MFNPAIAIPRALRALASHLAAIALAACLMLPLSARADEPEPVSVQIGVNREKVYLGDTFRLEVQVSGSRNAQPPDLAALIDAAVTYDGPQDSSMVSTTIINGRVSTHTDTRYSFLYSITPRKPGTLNIPPATVVVGGKAFSTRALSVQVLEVPLSLDASLEASIDTQSAYVGQPVRLRLTWTLARKVKDFRFAFPDIANVDILPGPDAAPPGTPAGANGFVNIVIGSDQQRCRVESRIVGDRTVTVLTIDRAVIPRAPGTITIPPVRVDFEAATGQRQRGMFDAFWDDLTIYERQHCLSKPLTFSVRDLPTAGRPKNFSGLVGKYALAAKVDHSDASVGEPLQFAVQVTGPHPLSLVPALDLNAQSIARSFRVQRDPVLPDVGATTATFATTIRPRSQKSTTIPPIELNYFDTETASYQIARSAPIPLNIHETTTVGLESADSDAASQPPESAPEPPAPKSTALLLRAEPRSLPLALAFDPLASRSLRPIVWILAMVAAPLVVAAIWIVLRAARTKNPLRQRRRLAYSEFRQAVAQAESQSDALARDRVARAVRRYVALSTDESAGELTAPEAVERVRTVRGSAHADRLHELLDQLDTSRFAPGVSSSDRPSTTQARTVVSSLHRDWRSGGAT